MAGPKASTVLTLVSQPDAVDLIRFENLLQIGFWCSRRRGKKLASSRRIEQWVNRDSRKIRVSAEFRSSDVLGLPSTADRDKYVGFMKLLMDMRLKPGLIQNPIRFSGYSLLKVLGQCDSGENYEALNNWGLRMGSSSKPFGRWSRSRVDRPREDAEVFGARGARRLKEVVLSC